MIRSLTRIIGVSVAGLVLAAAFLFWAFVPRFEAEVVAVLEGPGGVVATHSQGSAGATTGLVDLVELSAGRRSVEVLRVDQAEALGMRWLDAGRFELCIGDARVYRYEPEVKLGGATVAVIVAPVPAADCGR